MLENDVTITAVVHPDGEIEMTAKGDFRLVREEARAIRETSDQVEKAFILLGIHMQLGIPRGLALEDLQGNRISAKSVGACGG